MDNEKGFGVVDNCVFAGMLIISAVIGLYISYKGSFSAEVYANGLQISTIALGCLLAIIFSSYFLLPVLYSLKLTSINEILHLELDYTSLFKLLDYT
ncbi:hypothetical protein Avbf_18367 [Armadillidium vulgare]|nr:hypothetical protein Avbf_18367 [Armadillidium vulgare]